MSRKERKMFDLESLWALGSELDEHTQEAKKMEGVLLHEKYDHDLNF